MLTRKDLTPEQAAFLKLAALAGQRARREAWERYQVEILASVAIAQAIRETGWGRHAPANNYFGLKAPRWWTGLRRIFRTWEIIRGRRIETKAAFRAYASMQASFIDYARHVAKAAPYAKATTALAGGLPDDLVLWNDQTGALRRGPRWEAYARLVAETWATDPEYGDGIVALIRGLVLRGFDQPLQR